MATRRRRTRIRDTDKTKRLLLDAVGQIVREVGFHAIGVNRIAQLADKDKSVIRYHFGSLAELLKVYINEQDYWPPFFERYKLGANPDQSDVRQLFIALMQENLDQFYGNKEMQKIILWQITDSSALLRQVSELREAEGEKLLNLANETFLNSGISFKAIVAMILGGTYFTVLQAHSIKSKVCGVDLNWQRDFQVFRDTIAQVISWAWEKANAENRSSIVPMSYELEKLEELCDRICASEASSDLFTEALKQEFKKVERLLSVHLLTLTNETQIVTFLQVYLARLVKLCDALYDWDEDRGGYASMLLELMDSLRQQVAVFMPEHIVIPVVFRKQQTMRFEKLWLEFSSVLTECGIEQKLQEVMYLPLKVFGHASRDMKWCDFKYLNRYMSVLKDLLGAEFSMDMLLDTLIGLGFNHSRFAGYVTRRIEGEIRGKSGAEAKEVLSDYQSRLRRVSMYTKRVFDSRKLPVTEELNKWLEGEMVRQAEKRLVSNPFKLISKLKAVQLAFWKKLQFDHGVYEEDNLDIFTEKIAYNFSTRSQEDLSASSLKSKLYPKDRSTVTQIEKILVDMLEDVRKFL